MPNNHKVEVDSVVEASHHTPEKVLNHGVVFILSTAVVGVEADRGLTESVMAEEVFQHGDYGVCTLASVTGFVDHEIYLPWKSLAANSKDCCLLRGEKIDWAGPKRVVGIMHLLSEVKCIMHCKTVCCRCYHPVWWRRNKLSLIVKVGLYCRSALLHCPLVHRLLLGNKHGVLFCSP